MREIAAQVLGYLTAQMLSLIKHGKERALNGYRMIQIFLNHIDGLKELAQAF